MAAIVVAVPGQVRLLLEMRGETAVPLRLVTVGAVVQQSLLAVGLVAVGTAFAPRVGLDAPWFRALARGEGPAFAAAMPQLLPAVILGGAGTAVFLWMYYRVFRPRMLPDDVARTERLRNSMGLMGRLAMGGVAEEVMFRWGVMSALAWLAIGVMGLPAVPGMWTAIVVGGAAVWPGAPSWRSGGGGEAHEGRIVRCCPTQPSGRFGVWLVVLATRPAGGGGRACHGPRGLAPLRALGGPRGAPVPTGA